MAGVSGDIGDSGGEIDTSSISRVADILGVLSGETVEDGGGGHAGPGVRVYTE